LDILIDLPPKNCTLVRFSKASQNILNLNIVSYTNLDITQIEDKIHQFGKLISANSEGEKLIEIIPGISKSKNTLTTRYGFGAFPFHTDTAYWEKPAKYIALYCKNEGDGNRPTLFVELEDILKENKIYKNLKESFFALKIDGKNIITKPIFSKDDEICIRYDKDCMIPQNESAKALISQIDQLSEEFVNLKAKYWKSGDLIIFNNYKLLHSRGNSQTIDSNRTLIKGLIL
jgi:L-asparagine oxygenase